MELILNGQKRSFEQLSEGATLSDLIAALQLKSDRVALEVNGAIFPRAEWNSTTLQDHDKLELVHFVGGGASRTVMITPWQSPCV